MNRRRFQLKMLQFHGSGADHGTVRSKGRITLVRGLLPDSPFATCPLFEEPTIYSESSSARPEEVGGIGCWSLGGLRTRHMAAADNVVDEG